MKRLILTALAALVCTFALAIPAYRGFINYTQPDGTTIRLRMAGDEFCHWLTDASGQVYEQAADGYFRPADASNLEARRSAARIRREAANKQRRRMAPAKGSGHVAVGQKHFLVILVAFKDQAFKSSTANADFTALLNEQGYSVNGGTGSARDYYYDNSHGYFEPIFDVYGPVTLANNTSTYGGNDSSGNDKAPEDAVIQGCQALDAEIDFSQYDNDGDGEVDLVFMYYAGKGEADGGATSTIWPHQWELSSAGKSLTLDGTRIDKYACTNEIVGYGTYNGKMCGIGTACHEFGHAMGLPDFYDTDYETNGEAGGLYDYSIMCGGGYNNEGHTPPYFNIEERILLGWLDGSVIRDFPSSGTYVIPGIDNNITYRTPTDMDGEYFVYECRSKSGWDKYIPQAGLIVYHVDKSSRKVSISNGYSTVSVAAQTLWSNWQSYNSINENGSHPCFYIIPAASQSSLNYTGSSFAFPGSSKTYTTYTAQSWNGVSSDISLSNITYSSNQVSLYATVPTAEIEYTVIANPGNGHYTAGEAFTFELEEATACPVQSVLWYYDDEPAAGPTVILTAGVHTVEAHLTLADGSTQIVTLEITVD